jgi:hypothetical protein
LLEQVLDNPDLNTAEALLAKAKELATLSDPELRVLGEAGKDKKAEVEEKELAKIRSKFHVK